MDHLAKNRGNPFPGLRPFREDEEFLFFGRESQVDAMVNKLAAGRFLAVVGTSGSGKSSLVNCGLRPALHRGLMAGAGSTWHMAQMRPGSDPIGALAKALSEKGVLFDDYDDSDMPLTEIVETTLRMSKLGLVDMFEQSGLGGDDNLLVVADQFEELFRYRKLGASEDAESGGVSQDAVAFVNLLLEASEQTDYPIYVVLTMRSDFLGDCAQFSGLAEAINDGQYLVPRMQREQRRAAISGPIRVGGAEITPVLLTRLVNDVGDNPDQLSILQHALNRTWARWQFQCNSEGAIDLEHYDSIGTMANALDQHADKAYSELTTARQRQLCEKLFRAITDKATDTRGVRRPTKLSTLKELTGASYEELRAIIEVFRKPSRSFLMPPVGEELTPDKVVDISHESLMRVWRRLRKWADKEARSAQMFERLAETAQLHSEGKASPLREQDLRQVQAWRRRENPNEPWAEQYRGDYHSAIDFLERSEREYQQSTAETNFLRKFGYVKGAFALLLFTTFLIGPIGLISDDDPLRFKSTSIEEIKERIDEALAPQGTEERISSSLHIVLLPRYAVDEIREKIRKKTKQRKETNQRRALTNFNDALVRSNKFEKDFLASVQSALKSSAVAELGSEHTMSYAEDSARDSEHTLAPARNSANTGQSESRQVGYASDGIDLPLPQSLFASLSERTQSALKEQGVDAVSDFRYIANEPIVIYAIPATVSVMAEMDDHGDITRAVLGYEIFIETSRSYPKAAEFLLHLIRALIHLFAYFSIVYVVGRIYRPLALASPTGDDLAAWQKHGLEFQGQVTKLFRRLGRGRAQAIFTYAGLSAAAAIFISGLQLHLFPDSSGLMYGMSLGVVLALLVPLNAIVLPSRLPSVKIVQGHALSICGYYSLAGMVSQGFAEIIGVDIQTVGHQALWLPREPVVGLLVGLALLILGNRKRFLSGWEVIARSPDRPAVIYLQSFEDKAKTFREIFSKWIGRSWKPRDEQIIESAFSAVGPFVRARSRWESIWDDVPGGADSDAQSRREEALQALDNSALVIIQIDDGHSDRYWSNIEQVLRSLKPTQIMLYFSQHIANNQLSNIYRDFLEEMQSVFPTQLPTSIRNNRFLAFDEKWNAKLYGANNNTHSDAGHSESLFGRRLAFARLQGRFAAALRPFFEQRKIQPATAKLYGDWSIGTAGFIVVGLGITGGIMIALNLWRLGRRKTAFVGLIAPWIVFGLVFALAWIIESVMGLTYDIETGGLIVLAVLASPFLTVWLWRRLAGPQVRYHKVLGGKMQPAWKSVLVVLVWFLLLYIVLFRSTQEIETRNTARDDASYAEYLARYNQDIDGAILIFEEALEADPDFKLNRNAPGIDNDPETVAYYFAAMGMIDSATSYVQAGDLSAALDDLKKANEYSPGIDLYPDMPGIQSDPQNAIDAYAAVSIASNAEYYARWGSVDEALSMYRDAIETYPAIDLEPRTARPDRNPEAVTSVYQGQYLAGQKYGPDAQEKYAAALRADPGIDLNPHTAYLDQTGSAVVQMWQGQLFAQLGRNEDAERSFAEAIRLDPNIDLGGQTAGFNQDVGDVINKFYAIGLVSIGARLALEQNTEEAARYLQKALEIDESTELNWVSPGGYRDPEGVAESIALQAQSAIDFDPTVTVDQMIASWWPHNIVSKDQMIARAAGLVITGAQLARAGNSDESVVAFEEALLRNPEIDLIPATDAKDQDPAEAARWFANPPDIGDTKELKGAEEADSVTPAATEDSEGESAE
jgi:tetratricopeptide (TPR) repeat protein